MKLYSYWRSSSAYRVRIALALKGLAYETVPVDIRKDGGEQHKAAYKSINPNARVPALMLDDGTVLTQSVAIIEWLEEAHPEPPLLPRDPVGRARCRALAHLVEADIQPLQGLGVLKALKIRFGAENQAAQAWAREWIERGFTALEAELARLKPTPFPFGAPGLFEALLIPQVYNARSYGVDLAKFPAISTLDAACLALPAFAAAAPEVQPDAPPGAGSAVQ
jgi:maleylacetoacetate isomerase